MPDPQHADPEGFVPVARKQLAWPQETPPLDVGKAIEKFGAPHPTEPAELQTLVRKTD